MDIFGWWRRNDNNNKIHNITLAHLTESIIANVSKEFAIWILVWFTLKIQLLFNTNSKCFWTLHCDCTLSNLIIVENIASGETKVKKIKTVFKLRTNQPTTHRYHDQPEKYSPIMLERKCLINIWIIENLPFCLLNFCCFSWAMDGRKAPKRPTPE